MKKILMAATAVAAIGIAAPAFAQDTTGPQVTTFNINANNPPKCKLNADNTTVTLANDSISNDGGRARNNIGNKVAQGLNGLGVKAWCTGARNSIVLTRSALATGNGDAVDGFNQAVIYDITLDIADANRVDGYRPTEGSSDGPGNGPGVGVGSATPIGHFGPTGAGSAVHFENEGSSTSEGVTSDNGGEAARSAYSGLENNARLTAGTYTGTVTVTLTPGD